MSAIPLVLNKITSIIHSKDLFGSLYNTLAKSETFRIKKIQKYWDYYNHQHYNQVSYREEDLPFFPYCTAFIQKVITWMVGTPPKYYSREDIAYIMDEMYSEILENSGDDMHYNAVEMGSVTGDCLLAIQFDMLANEGSGGFAIKVIDSDKMFLEYRNVGQHRVLSRVLIFWEELDAQGNIIITAELWDEQNVIVYSSGPKLMPHLYLGNNLRQVSFPAFDSGMLNTKSNNVAVYENPYGELPFVHIKNLPSSRDVLGISDMDFLYPINLEMDEQILNYKENVDYHSNPILLMYNVRAKDLEKSGRRTWAGLPKDAKIEYLSLRDSHESILKYIDLLKEAVGLSGVSKEILNHNNLNFRDTSHASLRLAFLPLVELVERKTITYAEGFAKAMEKAIRFTNDVFELGLESLNGPNPRLIELLQANGAVETGIDLERFIALRSYPFYTTKVVFIDHLPRNKALENASIRAELEAGLESIDSALRRMGVNDVSRKKEDILKTAKFRGEYNRILQESMMPPSTENNVNVSEQPGASSGVGFNDVVDEGGDDRTPEQVEEETGQSAERTQDQRNMKGQGDV